MLQIYVNIMDDHLNLRKIAIWMSKNCQKLKDFFFLIAKNLF